MSIVDSISILLAVSLIFQSIENLILAPSFARLKKWYRFNFSTKGLQLIFIVQFVMALLLLAEPFGLLLVLLIALQILISINFRGPLNGGADYMTNTILIGLLIHSLGNSWKIPLVSDFGILWIGVQVLLSYLVAGIVKINSKDWRSGYALTIFAKQSPFSSMDLKRFSVPFSFFIIVFELSSLGVIFNTQFALGFIGVALIFHLVNWWYLGINRFFWVWLAGLPSLMYLSNYIN